MNPIQEILDKYTTGVMDKASFIKCMYEEHHAGLFNYAGYLFQTNIKKIEIEDDSVIMTSRDQGVRIACSLGDFRIAPIEILNFLDYEKLESAMMENLIADGDIFFDIGANIGWYSIRVALSRRAAMVFCFEPIPKTYRYLQKNLDLNSVPNVQAHNFGFSNQAGKLPFYYYPEGSGNASSAILTQRMDMENVSCEVRILDDYITETGGGVDFIKCDVEGAELLVFKGGLETIAREKPIVFSEILRKWSKKFNYNPNEIFHLFREQGYQSFTVKGNYLVEFFSMDESTVETNFFFLHSEKHKDQIRRYKK
jgi:FkbM family methyltransferase